MDINSKSNYNMHFDGIRLSDSNFNNVKKIALSMKFNGYNVFGHRTFYVNNDFESKMKVFKFVRKNNGFLSNDFGFVFLPWSKEAYIVGSQTGEQILMKKLLKLDKKAKINLMF